MANLKEVQTPIPGPDLDPTPDPDPTSDPDPGSDLVTLVSASRKLGGNYTNVFVTYAF
jgi:hypothetical protein